MADEHDVEDEASDEDNGDDNGGTSTDISVELGGLSVEVSSDGHTQEETEEMFYRIWDYVEEDAEEMSEALRDRMGGQ